MGCDVIPIRTEPKSDQINADDLAAGQTLVLTVRAVRPGPDAKQAIDIVSDHPRVYRPCLTMRRVLMACWGGVVEGQLDPAAWVGKRIELYTDPTVRFGSDVTGGLRIRPLSGIAKPWSSALTTTKGKRATYTVGVLADAPHPPSKPAPVAPTELPKFVAAVESLTAGLTVPLLREYLSASGIEIDTLDARALSAVVADLRAPAEVERLAGWMADRASTNTTETTP